MPFALFADALPDALLLLDSTGRALGANSASRRMLGRSTEELQLLALEDLVEDEPVEIQRHLSRWRRSSAMLPGTLTFRPATGPSFRCRAEGAALKPPSPGGPRSLLLRCAARDEASQRFLTLNRKITALNAEIAQRRRAELLLEEERERLSVTLASIGDAVIVTDVDGCATFMNPVAERMTGYSSTEALGVPLERVFRILDERTRQPAVNPVRRVLKEGVVVGLANHTILVSRDGKEYSIDDTAAPIRDHSRHLIGAVLVFHDVTDRRVLERELAARLEALAETDRRKDEFLAMLSHELRNPLAAIANALELQRLLPADDPARERASGMLDRQVRLMHRIVDDLLDVSRVARGRIDIERAVLELGPLLEEKAADVERTTAEKGLEIEIDLPPGRLCVEGDRTRLGQVLGNLLDNAVKYTGPGGRIRLSAASAGDHHVIRVRDTGLGIDPGDQKRIFEIFEQGHRTIDRGLGGLGVGLALVRLLVEKHGGTVTVRSEGRGRGSEFEVRLPAVEAPVPEGNHSPQRKSASRRVLVVDDNHDAGTTLAMLLDVMSHEVRIAMNGPEALATLLAWTPDLVLLDLGLPGMDGYEVARRIRAADPDRQIVLAAVTGYGQASDRENSRAAGFDHHLVKPVPPDTLRDLLTKI